MTRIKRFLQGGAVWLARLAHNEKVTGSNPVPATPFGSGQFAAAAVLKPGSSPAIKRSGFTLRRFFFLPAFGSSRDAVRHRALGRWLFLHYPEWRVKK